MIPPMRSFHQRRIKGNDGKKGPEAKPLLQQEQRYPQLWEADRGIQVKFSWIITWFPMNIDSPSEIRRDDIITPVIIREPCVGGCNRHKIAPPLLPDSLTKAAFPDFGNAFRSLYHLHQVIQQRKTRCACGLAWRCSCASVAATSSW